MAYTYFDTFYTYGSMSCPSIGIKRTFKRTLSKKELHESKLPKCVKLNKNRRKL